MLTGRWFVLHVVFLALHYNFNWSTFEDRSRPLYCFLECQHTRKSFRCENYCSLLLMVTKRSVQAFTPLSLRSARHKSHVNQVALCSLQFEARQQTAKQLTLHAKNDRDCRHIGAPLPPFIFCVNISSMHWSLSGCWWLSTQLVLDFMNWKILVLFPCLGLATGGGCSPSPIGGRDRSSLVGTTVTLDCKLARCWTCLSALLKFYSIIRVYFSLRRKFHWRNKSSKWDHQLPRNSLRRRANWESAVACSGYSTFHTSWKCQCFSCMFIS